MIIRFSQQTYEVLFPSLETGEIEAWKSKETFPKYSAGNGQSQDSDTTELTSGGSLLCAMDPLGHLGNSMDPFPEQCL